MRFTVTTPSGVIVDTEDVAHVRAEDDTGAFGVMRGHADLLGTLVVSVVTWRDEAGTEHHVAVRGGVIDVHGGDHVDIATREAQTGDDLDALERDVLARYRREAAETAAAGREAARLEAAIVRRLLGYLRPGAALVSAAREVEP
jgi:F-type H+-transporting ATPase subunit epsilon